MNNLEHKILESLLEKDCRVHIRNAGIFRFPFPYRFNVHNHREVEMVYINSGHCIIGVDDEFVPMKQGDFIAISAGVPHCFIVNTRANCSITQLEFEMEMPEILGQELIFLRQNKHYYKLSMCETVRCLLENQCRIFRAPGNPELRDTQLLFGFFQLFIELSAKIQELEQVGHKTGKAGKIEDIIQYLNNNYESDIDMEQLAQQFRMSSRYIRKCFAVEVGMSCQQYITTLRIGKAKELLWFTSDTVTEIAMKTGFNSSQYFCRVFQQYTEMTPVGYRDLWKGSKAEELCNINMLN